MSPSTLGLVRTFGDSERKLLMGLDSGIEFCLRGDLEGEEIEVGLNRIVVGLASPKRTLLTGRAGEVLEEVRRLLTGSPSSVRMLMALRRAAGETLALATGEERWADRGFGASRQGLASCARGRSRPACTKRYGADAYVEVARLEVAEAAPRAPPPAEPLARPRSAPCERGVCVRGRRSSRVEC